MADNWGGARKGAGRKPLPDPKQTISIRLSGKALENINRAAVLTGKSRQLIINEWAEGLK